MSFQIKGVLKSDECLNGDIPFLKLLILVHLVNFNIIVAIAVNCAFAFFFLPIALIFFVRISDACCPLFDLTRFLI